MRNQAKLDFLKWRKIGRCYNPPGGSYYELFQRQIMERFFETWVPISISEKPKEFYTILKWIDPK